MNAEWKDDTVAELYVRLLGAEIQKDVRCRRKSMLLVRLDAETRDSPVLVCALSHLWVLVFLTEKE
jgi:hypothetical protein